MQEPKQEFTKLVFLVKNGVKLINLLYPELLMYFTGWLFYAAGNSTDQRLQEL